MAGGLFDELRQAREVAQLPVVEPGTSPTGALLGIAAALAFLETGGTTRVVLALTRATPEVHTILTRVVHDLLAGVQIAIAIAVPFVIASVLFETTAALVARAIRPAILQTLWAPVRTLFFLLLIAVLFERVLALVVLVASRVG
jgi:type III secretory pathway component EscT